MCQKCKKRVDFTFCVDESSLCYNIFTNRFVIIKANVDKICIAKMEVSGLKYIVYPIKNLIRFIKKSPVVFIIIIAGQIICVTSSFVVYSLIQNTRVEEKADEGICSPDKLLFIDYGRGKYGINDERNIDETYTIKEFREKLEQVVDYVGDDMIMADLYIFSTDENDEWMQNTAGITTCYVREDVLGQKVTVEDMTNTEHKISVSTILDTNVLDIGDKMTVGGEEYEVDVKSEIVYLYIKYGSLPWDNEDMRVGRFDIDFKKVPTYSYIKKLEKKLNEIFPDNPCIHFPEVEDLEKLQNSGYVKMSAALIVSVIIINLALIYQYILRERYKWLAIMRMCGCKKYQAFLIYFVEVILILSVSISFGYFAFTRFAQPQLIRIYPLIKELFYLGIHKTILKLYVIISVIIMSAGIVPCIRKNVVDMKRGGRQ